MVAVASVAVDWDHPFWARVWPEALSGCWLWDGNPGTHGYGQAPRPGGGPMTTAHRAAMEHVIGRRLVRKEFVCHRCNNKMCVNPDHLYVGTHKQNMNDVSRGRYHPKRKLTIEQVRRARDVRIPQKRVAREIGVSQRTVWNIRKGKAYRHDV